MSTAPSPQTPPYRYTLFFGPEYVEASDSIVHCVFNVKKRSWKGGIQVSVEIDQTQIKGVNEHIHFDTWLKRIIKSVGEDERNNYRNLGHDLFVQYLCQMKLELALKNGMRQENTTLAHETLVDELQVAIQQEPERPKQHVLTELDLLDTSV